MRELITLNFETIHCLIDLLSQLFLCLYDFISNNLMDICTLAVTITIAVVNYNFLRRQSEKDERNDIINRKTNFQSILILSKKLEITLFMDSVHNYTESLLYKNVLFKNHNTENGSTYACEIDIYLKNMTNIFPNEIDVHRFWMWDNTINKREKNEQLSLDFINYYPSYKEVTINGDKETCFTVLCCCDYDDLTKLKKINSKNRIFNFRIELSINNSCNITNRCLVRGKFRLVKKKDISDGNYGGTKVRLTFDVIDSYLNVKEILDKNS